MAVAVANLHPYKKNCYNIIDSVLWLVAAIGMSWFNYFKAYGGTWYKLVYLFGASPLLYLTILLCWTVVGFVRRRCQAYCAKRKDAITDEKNFHTVF